MDRPLLRDGAVVFDGLIRFVGDARKARRAHPDAQSQDLGQAILLPGLVNAHAHLELTDQMPQPLPAGGFIGWLAQRRAPRTEESIRQAVALATQQCLRFGVTAVGDISKFAAVTRPLLKNGPLRIVSYGEVIGMCKGRHRFEPAFEAATDAACAGDYLAIGISPHAPYTVDRAGYVRCRDTGLPLATHLAESPDEAEFLRDHTGPFRDLFERIGLWEDFPEHFAGGPIRYAQSLGLLDRRALLAHVNYADDDELAILAGGQASVVYCPRTHQYFGHPPHRWRDMLAAGINVAVGTDSCASSADLNLVDDLRVLRRIAPDVPAQMLWEMATVRAARAIGQEHRLGSLTVGKAADIVAFRAAGPDPLADILHGDELPGAIWIGGRGVS